MAFSRENNRAAVLSGSRQPGYSCDYRKPMTDKNYKEILNAVGRAWEEHKQKLKGKLFDSETIMYLFLDSLIPVERVWDAMELKNGDGYWYIADNGDVKPMEYYGGYDSRWRIASGNCFQTKAAAEAYYRLKMGL